MSRFDSSSPAHHGGRRRVWIAALAVLFLAGGGFAMAGGVAKLKSWLVRIEINGEVTEMEVGEDGNGIMTVNTDDGGIATVHMKAVELADLPEGAEGQTATVAAITIEAGGESGGQTEINVDLEQMVADGEFTITSGADLKEALSQLVIDEGENLTVLRAEEIQGVINAQIMRLAGEVAGEEGDGEMLVIQMQEQDGEMQARYVQGSHAELQGSDLVELIVSSEAARVEIGEDGVPVIRIVGEDGTERLIRIERQIDEEDGQKMMTVEVNVEPASEGSQEQ